MSTATNARRYLRAHYSGVLATLSQKHAGYPFGSVVTYVTDSDGAPVMLFSRLAEHTKNIAADPRVSLLAQDRTADVQAAARIAVVGDVTPIEPTDHFVARYRRLQPSAEQLLALGDFRFYRLAPTALRYIEGFGGIHWVGGEAFTAPANRIAEIEAEILEHMNTDHASALADYARSAGTGGTVTRMIGIDCDGFDLFVDDRRLRIDFETPVTNAGEARAALAALARRARGET